MNIQNKDQLIADVLSAKTGDLQSFERLVYAFEKPIFNYLLRIANTREDAEDLTQETFFKAFKAMASVEPAEHFKAWLYRIATNTAYDFLRRKRRTNEFTAIMPEDFEMDDLPGVNHHQGTVKEQQENSIDVAAALDKLRPDYKSALLLFYWKGLAYEEIATALTMPVGTVKTIIHRAKKSLQQTLSYETA